MSTQTEALRLAWSTFAAGLSQSDMDLLGQRWAGKRQPPPADWVRLSVHVDPRTTQALDRSRAVFQGVVGLMPASHSVLLRGVMHTDVLSQDVAGHLTLHGNVQTLSDHVQHAMHALHRMGALGGWRNELQAMVVDTAHSVDATDDGENTSAMAMNNAPSQLVFERCGHQFLGGVTHAVHVNALTPDGLMWCGRRALSKATDPGRLDNVCAGGVPVGESLQETLRREMMEEAGINLEQCSAVAAVATVRTSRSEAIGWHDEYLHVTNVLLPPHVVPRNQDGEVSGFELLHSHQVMQAIRDNDMTADAGLTVVQALGCSGFLKVPLGA
jgi:8-oxo-dGTP pyrophosphatase MutT (NUDIX family)